MLNFLGREILLKNAIWTDSSFDSFINKSIYIKNKFHIKSYL
jgi:hypothetical protein